jgi:uracil-DNA glycosylase
VTEAERRSALEAIAVEVRVCTNCRLHETRTRSVPGEGNADTEVVFVGEGPGFNEDREGRPFVGRAGALLVKLLASIGWRREDVFITNVVKCRPPENRDPLPDEIAACAPFLRRQLQVLDPAVVVTLGRYSMGRFMPGARISSAHGTVRPIDPETGASNALAFAMYHPAAALRSSAVERDSYADIASVPIALLDARARRAASPTGPTEPIVIEATAATQRTDATDEPAIEGIALAHAIDAALDPEAASPATVDLPDFTTLDDFADLDELATASPEDSSIDEPTPQLTLF